LEADEPEEEVTYASEEEAKEAKAAKEEAA